MAATFAWEGRFIDGLDAFRAYVNARPRYAWIRGLTVHHTWSPTIDQWAGLSTLTGTRNYYRDTLGWSAGPHLFIANGTRADGIFIGTPLDTRGIHAGVCNSTHLGMEIVGNYDPAPWPAPLREYVYSIIEIVFHWLNLPVNMYSLRGHRECLPNKTCPGRSIDMNRVRDDMAQRITHPEIAEYMVIGDGTRLRSSPTVYSGILHILNAGDHVLVTRIVTGQTYRDSQGRSSDQWAEMLYGGYIWLPLIKR
jgi:hypothetical protein